MKARTILLFPFRLIGIILGIALILVGGIAFIGTAAATGGGTVLIVLVVFFGVEYLWRQSHPKAPRKRRRGRPVDHYRNGYWQ